MPDLLAVVGPLRQLDKRLALDVPPLLNQVDAGVIAVANSRSPRTAESLARMVGWPVETVNRRVPHLLRSGALIAVGTRTYVRPPDLEPVGRLYAIEAKVRDWRRALRQVRTYSIWCDGYVIVMPELSESSTAGLLTAIVADGAGLVLGGRWIQRPRLAQRSRAQRLWGSEHAVAAFGAR